MSKKKCPACNSSRLSINKGDIRCDKCGYINKREIVSEGIVWPKSIYLIDKS